MTDYLTTEQVGAEIGMSADYVARQCKSGALKAKKLGTEWRIHRAALEQFMGSAEPAPATRKRMSARQMRRSA
jgi:excisionase family DNA binding protein